MHEHPQYRQMLEETKKTGAVIAASGLSGAQKVHLACALSEHTGRPLVYLCESERAAGAAMEDLSALMGASNVNSLRKHCHSPSAIVSAVVIICASRLLHEVRIAPNRRAKRVVNLFIFKNIFLQS